MLGMLMRSLTVICSQIWQRVLLQQVLSLVTWSEVGALDEVSMSPEIRRDCSARRGKHERVESSLTEEKDYSKVRERLGICGTQAQRVYAYLGILFS